MKLAGDYIRAAVAVAAANDDDLLDRGAAFRCCSQGPAGSCEIVADGSCHVYHLACCLVYYLICCHVCYLARADHSHGPCP